MKIGPADPEILLLEVNKSGTKQNGLPWQRPLRNWKKWTGSKNLRNYLPFGKKIVKIGPVDTEIALLIVKNEEINASKIDSLSGKFASGLNN